MNRSVFKQLSVSREEVLVGPAIGEDCSVVAIGADEVFVLSTDPITGTAKGIGSLAVHITVNDLAASGAEPIGLLVTALLPPGYEEEALKRMMRDLNEACAPLDVQVIGGHTEVTSAVNQPVLSVTGVGKARRDKVVAGSRMRPGDQIVMSKWGGIEGTAILANEREEELKAYLNPLFVDQAKELGRHLSVLAESRIALEHGVTAMHDATEGGIFGALWEMAEAAQVGLDIHLEKIPLKQETIEIANYFDINPYQLISSGSMLMATRDGEGLVEKLEAAGIPASVVGKAVEGQGRIVHQEDSIRSLEPAKADALYKALGKK
nr:AIR synthase family protein [Anaerotalea alkaliphila]